MSLKANKAGIWKTIWGLLPDQGTAPITNPDISASIQQTMDHEFGLDAFSDLWREIGVDPSNRMRMTTASARQNFIQSQQSVNGTVADTLLFDNNPQRSYIFITNIGSGAIQIAFKKGDAPNSRGVYLAQGKMMVIDGWLGQVYWDTLSQPGQVNYMEI